jgi:hypothetical protein
MLGIDDVLVKSRLVQLSDRAASEREALADLANNLSLQCKNFIQEIDAIDRFV